MYQAAPFEKLVCELSATFAVSDAEEFMPCVEGALRRIVEFFGVDRSTLLEFDGEEGPATVLACYAAPGIEPVPLGTFGDRFRWFHRELWRGETVHVPNLPDGLPPEADDEREHVVRVGMKSNLSFPLFVAGNPFGYIAIGSFRRQVRFSEEVVPRLRLLGEVLAGAIVRARSMQRLGELTALLEAENSALRSELTGAYGFENVVGSSAAIRSVLRLAGKVAATDTTVLLTGETGTGKGVIARSIHARSARADKPMISVNIAALPATLIESELFGHERGAFTGASAQRIGRFELARGGTLFIDEIGDLPPELQAKLLRAVQDGEFERLGSSRTLHADVRIIVATHHDLERAARAGRFRRDLLFRLSVFPIDVPPLRERREDIAPLAWHFVARKQATLGRSIERITPRTLAALRDYDWPGNVRELENVIERALVLTSGPVLDEGTILASTRRGGAPVPADDTLAAIERAHLCRVLEDACWKINGSGNAAERLGLHPSTLRLRMQKLGIRRPGPSASRRPSA